MTTTAHLHAVLARLGLTGIRDFPRAYWVVWCGMFMARLGQFVMPFLAIHLTKRGFNPSTIGWLSGSFGAGMVLAGPVGGALADFWGRRGTILMGLLGASVAVASFPQYTSPGAMAAAAFAMGFFIKSPRPAINAVVADVLPADQQRLGYAFLFWALNLAFSVSPIVGGILALRDTTLLFYVDASALLLFATVVLVWLPETRRKSAPSLRAGVGKMAASGPLRNGQMVAFLPLIFAFAFTFMQHVSTLPVAITQHGIDTSSYGLIMCLNGLFIVTLQPLCTGAMGRFDPRWVMALGGVLAALGFGLQAWAHLPWQFAACVIVWTLGEVAFGPNAAAYTAQLAPEGQKGRYLGAHQGAWGAAAAAAPVVGLNLFEAYGPVTWWLSLAAGLLLATLLHTLYSLPRALNPPSPA